MEQILLTIVLAPLVGSIIAGFWGGRIGRAGAHWVASSGVGIATLLSLYVLMRQISGADQVMDITVYNWMVAEGVQFEIGFLIDRLTAVMMSVVTFVSSAIWPTTSTTGPRRAWPDATATSAFSATSRSSPSPC